MVEGNPADDVVPSAAFDGERVELELVGAPDVWPLVEEIPGAPLDERDTLEPEFGDVPDV